METKQIIVFIIEEQRFALFLPSVERVIRAAEITRVPKAPEFLSGVINYRGKVVPIMNIRQHLGFPPREIDPDDQFILAHLLKQDVILVADSVSGVYEIGDAELENAEKVLPGVEYLRDLVKFKDGLILIFDLDQFLSSVEVKKMEEILEKTIKKKAREKARA